MTGAEGGDDTMSDDESTAVRWLAELKRRKVSRIRANTGVSSA
jgi:hypothetical protein